jgi:hypothetical protein
MQRKEFINKNRQPFLLYETQNMQYFKKLLRYSRLGGKVLCLLTISVIHKMKKGRDAQEFQRIRYKLEMCI